MANSIVDASSIEINVLPSTPTPLTGSQDTPTEIQGSHIDAHPSGLHFFRRTRFEISHFLRVKTFIWGCCMARVIPTRILAVSAVLGFAVLTSCSDQPTLPKSAAPEPALRLSVSPALANRVAGINPQLLSG